MIKAADGSAQSCYSKASDKDKIETRTTAGYSCPGIDGRRDDCMITLLLAFLIGFFAGLRSLTAPAATAWAVYLGWLRLERPLSLIGSILSVAILTLLALAELVA